LNNADWLTTISLTDFLRDVGKHFTVNQMIAKETVKSRLDRDDVGLSFTEFSYMLLQAYDFLRLNLDHDCTLQLGGSDQWGNITVGAELVRKSAGHAAYGRDDALATSRRRHEVRQVRGWQRTRVARRHDDVTVRAASVLVELRRCDGPVAAALLTFLDHDTIRDLDEATKTVPQERRAQRAAANAIVSMVHGDEAARKAERAGDALFNESIADLDEATLLQVVADAPSSTCSRSQLNEGIDVAELLVRCDLAASLSEARRFLSQGGVYGK